VDFSLNLIMSYESIVKKVETSLDGMVEHVQTNLDNVKTFSSNPKAHYVILPELYMAKGLREVVMLVVDPVGRLGKYVNDYKNRNK